MGIYTDYFIATDEEAMRLDLDLGVINPHVTRPTCRQEGPSFVVSATPGGEPVAVEGRPVDTHSVGLLANILRSGACEDEPKLLRAGDLPSLDVDDELLDECEGPWLYRYSDAFRDRLALVSSEAVAGLLQEWARADTRVSADAYEWLLPKLIALCSRARARGEALFAWQSL